MDSRITAALAALATIREKGDCQLNGTSVIGPGFQSIPPHRVGIAHLMLRPRFGLFDPVGTGKTPQALIAYGLLREKARPTEGSDAPPFRLVVVASKSALFQWQQAVDKFLVGVSAEVMGYDDEKRVLQTSAVGPRESRHAHWVMSDADILITTYTSMARDIDVLLPRLDNFGVVFDEAQRLKTHTQKLLRPAALKLSHKARYVWGLSATPMDRIEHIHSIMEVIRPGLFGSFRDFMEAYVDRVWVKLGKPMRGVRQKGFWHIKGYRNLDRLMAVLRPYYLKRPAAEINRHLPPVVFQHVELDFSEKQAAIYHQIIDKWFPSPEDPEARGRRLKPLASLTYAQMASDAPEVLGFEGVGSSKLDELARFLTEEVESENVIVYSRYEKVVTYICTELAKLKIKTVRITGKETAAERDAAKAAFNAGRTHVIVLNAAGGESLDLQTASIVLFYDLPWSWTELQQVIGRARRIGSPHEKVLAVLLINPGIDQHTKELLQDKESLVGETFGLDAGQMISAPLAGVQQQLYDSVRHHAGTGAPAVPSTARRGGTSG